MAYKGTVFKVKPKSIIVATEAFEFKEICRHGDAKPGQVITFAQDDILYPRKQRIPAMAVASVLIILLVATSMVRHFFVSDVYAYVGMDINPSLELAINKYLKVTEAEAGDTDAEKVLQSTEIAGLDVSTAVSTVLNTCSNLGYINDTTSHILLTTTINSPGKKQDNKMENLESELLSLARQELQTERPDVNVYVVKVEPEERKQAISKGVSAGRYFLWNKAREKGTDIPLEQIKTQSISETLRSNEHIEAVLAENAAKKPTSRSKTKQNKNLDKNQSMKYTGKEHIELKKINNKPGLGENTRPELKNGKSKPSNNKKSELGNSNKPQPGKDDRPKSQKRSEEFNVSPSKDSKKPKNGPPTQDEIKQPRGTDKINKKPNAGPAAGKKTGEKLQRDTGNKDNKEKNLDRNSAPSTEKRGKILNLSRFF